MLEKKDHFRMQKISCWQLIYYSKVLGWIFRAVYFLLLSIL
jgi:hypothetical protein